MTTDFYPPKSSRTTGYLLGIIGSAAYGMNPLFAFWLYEDGFTSGSILMYRYLGAIILLALMILARGGSLRIRKGDILPLIIMGLLFSASSITLFESYHYLDAGIASTLLFMYPILVALIMGLVYRERISVLTMLSIAAALYGITLLNEQSGGRTMSLTGFLLVFLSALSYAIYLVAVSKSRLKDMDSWKLTFYALLFGSSIYIIQTDFLMGIEPIVTLRQAISVLGLSVFPTIISMVLITMSIHRIGSTSASILGALEPIAGVLVGVLALGEVLTMQNIIGIFVVLTAVTLIVSEGKIKEKFQERRNKVKQ